MGRTGSLADDEALAFQALQQRLHRGVGPAPPPTLQRRVDRAYRLRSHVPQGLEDFQLGFSDRRLPLFHGVAPVDEGPPTIRRKHPTTCCRRESSGFLDLADSIAPTTA